MAALTRTTRSESRISLHSLGVVAGLVAGVWLGAAEAPTKLVNIGVSPFTISLCMVAGVFVARWTFPTLLKGTSYVFADLREKKHLIVWALLAGSLWAVANTLTIFAIRDVGLAIAFPLWNTNLLIGLVWGRVLFGELKDASGNVIMRVVLGAVAIVVAALLLGFISLGGAMAAGHHAAQGIIAALGASLMWGTMYVPYRKAYLSGMNPLSFVTTFTAGELLTMAILAVTIGGGARAIGTELHHARADIFWLFLGGFVWVVGDLFQQFAAKYLGIGRGIPLSNTNQLWGLAWGALVFGELAGASRGHLLLVLAGSITMVIGAALISSAKPSQGERTSCNAALLRECDRYGLDHHRTLAAMAGEELESNGSRRWWDYLIVLAATGIFIYLGTRAAVPALHFNAAWLAILSVILLLSLLVGAVALFQRTRFC